MGLNRKDVGELGAFEVDRGRCIPMLGANKLANSWLEKVKGLLAQSGKVGELIRSSVLRMGGGVMEVGLSSRPLVVGKPAKLKLCWSLGLSILEADRESCAWSRPDTERLSSAL